MSEAMPQLERSPRPRDVRRAGRALVASALRAKLSPSARAVQARRDGFHRDLWLAAADHLGLPAAATGGSAVTVQLPDRPFSISRGGSTIEDAAALERAGDKERTARALAAHGIPVPEQVVTSLGRLDEIETFCADIWAHHGTVVVKPARDTSAGRGVTTSVRDIASLRTAAVAAAAAGSRAGRTSRSGHLVGRLLAKYRDLADVPLLVERQVPGANYRLLYLDGELVDAVRRAVPTVVGDGVSTVRGLVLRSARNREAAPVERGGLPVTVDEDMRLTLAAQGLGPGSVPAAGTVVTLKTAVNEGAIADQTPAWPQLCADVVEQGAEAARLVGGRLVGVDVITTDPRVPLAEAGGVVLEVNTTPGLAYHYHGKPGGVDVARAVLARLAGVRVSPS
jgi:cyanophycin synthetase